MISRRGLLGGFGALLAAPPIVRVSSLMPVSAWPSGWVLCDGRALSKRLYRDLFAVVGSAYGGNETTFRVPDFRDHSLVTYEVRATAFKGDWVPVGAIATSTKRPIA